MAPSVASGRLVKSPAATRVMTRISAEVTIPTTTASRASRVRRRANGEAGVTVKPCRTRRQFAAPSPMNSWLALISSRRLWRIRAPPQRFADRQKDDAHRPRHQRGKFGRARRAESSARAARRDAPHHAHAMRDKMKNRREGDAQNQRDESTGDTRRQALKRNDTTSVEHADREPPGVRLVQLG